MSQLQILENGDVKSVVSLAALVTQSAMFPSWKGKANDAAIAILFGQSLGLSWGHSLLNIAVINGRPTVWGDAMLALCRKSPSFEYCHETFDKKTMTAFCAAKRKGEQEEVRSFSKEDAERAKLWGRNVWASYPDRMLQMRARAFALRDVFADVLQGLGCAEEVRDYDIGDASYQVSEVRNDSKNEDFEKRRRGAFKGFHTLGIAEDVIFAFFKKGSINEFNEHDVEHLVQIGKSITAGDIEVEDAFKLQPTKSDALAEELLAKGRATAEGI